MTLEQCKNRVAQSKGYPNWDEFYNWVSRDGQIPCVTAQLIESAMQDAFDLIHSRWIEFRLWTPINKNPCFPDKFRVAASLNITARLWQWKQMTIHEAKDIIAKQHGFKASGWDIDSILIHKSYSEIDTMINEAIQLFSNNQKYFTYDD